MHPRMWYVAFGISVEWSRGCIEEGGNGSKDSGFQGEKDIIIGRGWVAERGVGLVKKIGVDVDRRRDGVSVKVGRKLFTLSWNPQHFWLNSKGFA